MGIDYEFGLNQYCKIDYFFVFFVFGRRSTTKKNSDEIKEKIMKEVRVKFLFFLFVFVQVMITLWIDKV